MSATNTEDEETFRTEVLHEVEELEASMSAAGKPVTGATISSIFSRAMATNQPQEVVQRILRLTKEPSGSAVSNDTTGLDASMEVTELRKLKEEVVRPKRGVATLPHPPGKENKGKTEGDHTVNLL